MLRDYAVNHCDKRKLAPNVLVSTKELLNMFDKETKDIAINECHESYKGLTTKNW